MPCLSIGFILALSLVLLVASLDDSLNNWSSLWNEDASVSLNEPIQVLDQDEVVSDKVDPSIDELYSTNDNNLDAISAASQYIDSSSIDLFATTTNEQPDECVPIFSSPLSRVRPRGPQGFCPGSDNSGIDALTLNERIQKLWCSETAIPGFQNIPVCKSYGPDTADSAMLSNSPDFPSYQLMIPLPGAVTLKSCYLSMFDSKRRFVSFKIEPFGAFFQLQSCLERIQC